MFTNIGKKIKALAKVICWIQIVIYIITAIVMFVIASESYTEGFYIALAFAFLIIGPIFAWFSSFFMYGFGELIDKACEIERNTRGGEIKSNTQMQLDNERKNKIENLRLQGLITEEEYQNVISKI
jgi:hypothetical protein